jgi:hypothetical protein
MKSILSIYPIYDLSNPHFRKITLLTIDDRELKGRFVQFKVVKDSKFEYLYPSEKYCFLPEDKQEIFWATHNSSNGEFKDFPTYILQMGLDDIKRITIEPLLVA